jgi:hypothetical protein
MEKTSDLRNGDYLAAVWRLDGAGIRAVFVERQMGLRVVIVIEIREQNARRWRSLSRTPVCCCVRVESRSDDPRSLWPILDRSDRQ